MATKKILHVDDDRLITRSVGENIELYLENCDVETANNYTDAIDQCVRQTRQILKK